MGNGASCTLDTDNMTFMLISNKNMHSISQSYITVLEFILISINAEKLYSYISTIKFFLYWCFDKGSKTRFLYLGDAEYLINREDNNHALHDIISIFCGKCASKKEKNQFLGLRQISLLSGESLRY